MGSICSNVKNIILGQDKNNIFYSLIFGSFVLIIFVSSRSYIKCILKRFIRIQLRKRLMDPPIRPSDTDAFTSYYRNILCHMQNINNELLGKILQKNYNSGFFTDRSIPFLSTHRPSSAGAEQVGYASIDEFREKVPLTTYDDYRPYVDRMVAGGEKRLLSSDNPVFYATTSGTTGKIKLIPVPEDIVKKFFTISRIAFCSIWRSLSSSSFPSSGQRWFTLQNAKMAKKFERSQDGVPIGVLSQTISVVPSFRGFRKLASFVNVIAFDLIEQIDTFNTSTFVQLVFALTIPDIAYYMVPYAPAFIQTIQMIEHYFEEISLCISSANFDHSTFVRDNIHDRKFKVALNRALEETAIEYGGRSYQLERAAYIRKQCLRKDLPGILHRLWPSLIFVSTTTGGSFAIYKQQIKFYCGEKVPLINTYAYIASEGMIGTLASISTDEYFLSPTSVFFEFIKEEDSHQTQPKTLLISEIEPGNRYELVITNEIGFIRYRIGDMISCTRFLSRDDNLIPLPANPIDIPRIPLISFAYRLGSLLNASGEKTSEQHIMHALNLTVQQWRQQEILVNMCDFTTYMKLDVFPVQYIIFLELTEEKNGKQESKIDHEQLRILQNIVDNDVEQHLRDVNHKYKENRRANRLGPLICILVRNGTFSTFLDKELITNQIGPLQIKPHRLLKNEHHIQFFYDHQIHLNDLDKRLN